MPDVWVSNASPLILLSHINQLNLLPELNPKIVIPHAVVLEVSVNRQDSNLNQFLSSPGVEELESPLQVEANIAGWDLGKGESEVLSWALKHPGSEVLLDDLALVGVPEALGFLSEAQWV